MEVEEGQRPVEVEEGQRPVEVEDGPRDWDPVRECQQRIKEKTKRIEDHQILTSHDIVIINGAKGICDMTSIFHYNMGMPV